MEFGTIVIVIVVAVVLIAILVIGMALYAQAQGPAAMLEATHEGRVFNLHDFHSGAPWLLQHWR